MKILLHFKFLCIKLQYFKQNYLQILTSTVININKKLSVCNISYIFTLSVCNLSLFYPIQFFFIVLGFQKNMKNFKVIFRHLYYISTLLNKFFNSNVKIIIIKIKSSIKMTKKSESTISLMLKKVQIVDGGLRES